MKREKHTILVVDDDPNDQTIIQMALREAGVRGPVQVVSNGAEAISYLNGEGRFSDRRKFEFPSFIILDLKMPLVDGFGVLEALRKQPDWAIIPTVILSGSADEDDIRQAYRLGANSYLEKPADINKFSELIKHFYGYWSQCHVPRCDATGAMLETRSLGKLGERFAHAGTY